MSEHTSSSAAGPKFLVMWAVYRDPDDFPGEVVARKFEVYEDGSKATDQLLRLDRLRDMSHMTPDQFYTEQLRAIRDKIKELNPGAVCIPRSTHDLLSVVETWL